MATSFCRPSKNLTDRYDASSDPSSRAVWAKTRRLPRQHPNIRRRTVTSFLTFHGREELVDGRRLAAEACEPAGTQSRLQVARKTAHGSVALMLASNVARTENRSESARFAEWYTSPPGPRRRSHPPRRPFLHPARRTLSRL